VPAAGKPAPPPDKPEAIDLPTVLIGLAMLVGFFYTVPVLLAINAPISGLIFGFALWEAWKINRKAQWSFAGPFRVNAKLSNEAAAEINDGG
jgi:hypothetical protein